MAGRHHAYLGHQPIRTSAYRIEPNSRARTILRAAAILLPALALVAITWFGAFRAIDTQRREMEGRIGAQVNNQAASFGDQIGRRILELDQTLRILAAMWATDPAKFNLVAWHDRTLALSDISRGLLLADRHGVVVQSTVPELIGTDISSNDYFAFTLQHGELLQQNDYMKQKDPDYAFIGPATLEPGSHRWFMPVAHSLRFADGSFGGAVVAYWNVSSITDMFLASNLGAQPLIALVGLNDGRLRALAGRVAETPGESIADTQMMAMLRATPDGDWIGRSELRGIMRLQAFRTLEGRDLAVVVGIDYDEALAPFRALEREAWLCAGAISILIMIIAGMLTANATLGRQRKAAQVFDRAMLTSAYSQLDMAKAVADARTAQLEATLGGISDGVAMMDAKFCLAEWNEQFPEVAGVPRELLRVGLPMEDILRAQANAGQFGPVDVDDEVARRMALLRSGATLGTVERLRPDGHTIEVRRNRLPDSGFVTLYADVTARKEVDDALHEATAIAEAASESKARFVAIVSNEIRTPLNALLATLTLLHDAGLPPTQQALLEMARQSGDALVGLIGDILDMSRMESGQITLRPSVFVLRELLDGVVEMFRPQATERGIILGLAASPALPRELSADRGRLRQVLINLLSNAVRFGQPGAIGMLAAREEDASGRPVLHVAVRDHGPVIEQAGRDRLFRPLSHLDGVDPGTDGSLGAGLGLAICRQLVTLMGGEIGCDPWMAEDGHAGNEFWVKLPIAPLPDVQHSPGADVAIRRIVPRTRILLVEDILANQLVTATLLRREGHLVDIAVNSGEALQAVARYPYDLVFMDIFMPGMSGFDVARRIRAMPEPACTVPIVALTANVSPHDQELCREAGVNRLLSKPVALPDLVEALTDIAWRGLPERSTTLSSATASTARSPVLSADRIGELRSSLPGEMLGGMVEECLIDLQARLPVLRRAMQAGNAEEVASQAHAMVGMAAGYGMAALETRLRALMLAARGSDTARAAVLAVELDTELSMAADALREALSIEMV